MVEYAKMRLRSVCTQDTRAPNNVVIEPQTNITNKKIGDNLYKSWNFKNRNNPAETSVAECINADAGAGASIESGNQKWKPNWADLQKAAISIKNKKRLSAEILIKKKVYVVLFKKKLIIVVSVKENEFVVFQ